MPVERLGAEYQPEVLCALFDTADENLCFIQERGQAASNLPAGWLIAPRTPEPLCGLASSSFDADHSLSLETCQAVGTTHALCDSRRCGAPLPHRRSRTTRGL